MLVAAHSLSPGPASRDRDLDVRRQECRRSSLNADQPENSKLTSLASLA